MRSIPKWAYFCPICLVLFLAIIIPIDLAGRLGDFPASGMNNASLSTIFRKGESTPVQGKLPAALVEASPKFNSCNFYCLTEGVIFFEAPLHLAISSGGLSGGQIGRVETGHNRIRVLS